MVSRLVLGLERKTPGYGGLGPVREEGNWGPPHGLPGDENSLAQPLGWPLTLTVVRSWSQGALSGACQPGAGLESGRLTAGPGSPERFLRANWAYWMPPTSLRTSPSFLSVHWQGKSLNPLHVCNLCSLQNSFLVCV